MSFVICGTTGEIQNLDKSSVIMSGGQLTTHYLQAYELLIENVVTTLVITDNAIHQQSTIGSIVEDFRALLVIHPNIRIIYFKGDAKQDSLTEFLNENKQWDIHYNIQISKSTTEEVIEKINSRKLRQTHEDYESKKSYREQMIKRADALVKRLTETLKKNPVAEDNEDFKVMIISNMTLVSDLMLSYIELKKELEDAYNELGEKDNQLKLIREETKIVTDNLNISMEVNREIDNNRKFLVNTINELSTKYNKLVAYVKEALNVEGLHSSLGSVIDTDDYTRPPLVLYIKEMTNVKYLTSYLETLTMYLTETLGLTKMLIIESDTQVNKIPYYVNKGFQHVIDGSPMSEFTLSNLFSLGYNPKLMRYLIQNSLQLDFLIVYDRTGWSENYYIGSQVIDFVSTTTLTDLETTEGLKVISNDPEAYYYIGPIKNYRDRIEGKQLLEISAIASLETTKKIIRFIKAWKDEQFKLEESEYVVEDSSEVL